MKIQLATWEDDIRDLERCKCGGKFYIAKSRRLCIHAECTDCGEVTRFERDEEPYFGGGV